jgi:hypothetical protein
MSRSFRYLLARVIVLLTIPIMLWCLGKIVPAGMNGNSHTVVRWFSIFAVTAAVGIVGFVVMTYTKARLDDAPNSEAEILARAAADMEREKQAARTAKDPANPSGLSDKTTS